jgi:hypothetical protein
MVQSMYPDPPKLCAPGRVVDRQLIVEDGELAVVYAYDDGLVVTLFVEEDGGARFRANRQWTVDEETGVVIFSAAVQQ